MYNPYYAYYSSCLKPLHKQCNLDFFINTQCFNRKKKKKNTPKNYEKYIFTVLYGIVFLQDIIIRFEEKFNATLSEIS